MARSGIPTPPQYLVGKRTRSGRHQHPTRFLVALGPWIGTDHRCLIPFTSFAENELQPDGTRPPAWFAFDETRPLAFLAGIWARSTSVRKLKEGEVTADLFGLLTTEPNAEVGAVHPKEMPAILTEPPGVGHVDDGALGRGEGAVATAAAAHRRAGREKGCAPGV